ncbi:MAG: EamA family transporter, partial [Xanthobacteraceae bacterium]
MNRRAILYVLASAALFGASTPVAKVLLGALHPAVLAGLLYCGAGVGIALLRRLAPAVLPSSDAPQVPLNQKDFAWLAGAIAAGGVAGPL